ncbi:response regulator [Burkholderia seminalis]|uniref:Response regulator n=1 Tax=Burkholderia cenocepacia TaxID=95486 RepID=A0ABD4U6C6_9BURK|nr:MULTISPECIES: response regulator [Burkholderia cepacia complex]HDR9769756.1 response regulator [Burkholderia cepacia ATCC 25416]MCA7954127.1 response regulator [Burkholderia seminalis]MCA8078981.1 response regulator [Burkholderia cepacia]MCW3694330.1 response regulator [Burkholderia cenocepacia]MCW3702443.1 response regulator [Burkholderia cenocepacia]
MRVLVVEDDALIGNGLLRGLRHSGFAVDWVRDGEAASTALLSTQYGLILLDLGLPGEDGSSVLARLRQRNDPTPVIIVTARDAIGDRVAGLDAGADDYLVKPFALEELLARIRVVSRRQTGSAQTVFRSGTLRLDPAQHRVWLGAEEVPLTAREFAILEELIRRPKGIVTREQLEECLYGWNEEVESNTVQVHIHHLRQKLGTEVIVTVRGIGYRIGAPE